jgi:hypothetical protein
VAIRPEVQQLVSLGPFPASAGAHESDIDRRGAILASIHPPVTNEEAAALMACFGPDDAFGLAWTLVHLIETAPELPLDNEPGPEANEWLKLLWDSAHR